MRKLVLVALWSAPAYAQDASAPPPVNSVASVEEPQTAQLWGGPHLDLMPGGTLHVAANGRSLSRDTDSAIGLGGVLEYRMSPYVAVGFAPRFVTPVRVRDASDSGWQLDLRARATGGTQVSPRVHLHGIATLGYSWMVDVLAVTDANGMPTGYQTTSGLLFGFGAGMSCALKPRLTLEAELSYQFGFQGTTIEGVDVSAGDNYLTFGFGLTAAIQ